MMDQFRVWLLRGQFGDGYGDISLAVRLRLRLFGAITPRDWVHPQMRGIDATAEIELMEEAR